jgi:hypothetical protein
LGSTFAFGCLGLVIFGGLIGFAVFRNQLTDLIWKSGPRIMFSREALSNGRTDTIRPLSTSNPMGLRGVAGFGDPDTGAPGLLTSIAAAPNPMRISLDEDRDGRVDGASNPIALDCTGLLTCFSLLVADEFPPEGVRWENIGARDSAGSLYATVNIPSANILAGQELITDAELRAYTANSILYESPDYGVSLASVIDTKGAIRVRAAPRPQPDTPRVQDLMEAPEMNYARDVKVEIEVVSVYELSDGVIEVRLRAKLTGFDPVGDSHFRWGYDGVGLKIVKDIVADNTVAFFLPANQKGQLVRLWVAVSSKGLGVGNPNPFVQQPPKQELGNMTFVTTGSAVAAMQPFTVQVGKTEQLADQAGKIKLKGVYVRRIYMGPGGRKDETAEVNGPLQPIRLTSRVSDAYADFDVTGVLTIQAPATIPPDERFHVTATWDVTWNIRRFNTNVTHYPLLASAVLEDYDRGRVRDEKKAAGSQGVMPGTYRATVTLNGKQMRGSVQGGGGNDLWVIGGSANFVHNDEVQVLLLYDMAGWIRGQ